MVEPALYQDWKEYRLSALFGKEENKQSQIGRYIDFGHSMDERKQEWSFL